VRRRQRDVAEKGLLPVRLDEFHRLAHQHIDRRRLESRGNIRCLIQTLFSHQRQYCGL
jgi:hypothetical protein